MQDTRAGFRNRDPDKIGVPIKQIESDELFLMREYHQYISDLNKKYFTKLWKACHGNISMMSRIANINRQTVYKRLDELGIKREVND